MSGFALSGRARQDLSEIWDYTAGHWGDDQADRYVRQIVAACSDLATGRIQGRSADDIRAGYFKHASGSHVLFYRIGENARLEVIRILHRRMDMDHHL